MTRTRRKIGAAIAAMAVVAVATTHQAGASGGGCDPQLLHVLGGTGSPRGPRHHRRRLRGREPEHQRRGADRRLRRLLHQPADAAGRRQRARHVRAQLRELRDLRPQRRAARPQRVHGRRRRRSGPLLPAGPGGLLRRRHPVRATGDVLRRRADLQQGAVRRRRPRLPDGRLDVGGRAGRRRGPHRRRRRCVRRLPAGQLPRVLQVARPGRRRVLRRRRQGDVQLRARASLPPSG